MCIKRLASIEFPTFYVAFSEDLAFKSFQTRLEILVHAPCSPHSLPIQCLTILATDVTFCSLTLA